jgi:small subunit ribosomal protein S4
LKGEKCATEKCPVTRRAYAPGQHGKRPVRVSEYGIRLREKQKARRIYGLGERQFEGYFKKASSGKGATGEKLLEFLERRLDNVVYRLGFATSRQSSRQIIRNGGILVNGRKVDIPSFQVKVGDALEFKPKIVPLIKGNIAKFPDHQPPVWLTVAGEAEGKVVALPKREDIDSNVDENLIVEYYSR